MSDDRSTNRETLPKTTQGLHLIKSPQQRQTTGTFNGRRRTVLVAVVLAFVGICAIVFLHTPAEARSNDSRSRGEANDLVQELHSLTQSNLIQFSDGRIWYVRSVRGDNMEVVGWIGDNTKVESIPSFALSGDEFRIIRKGDSDWNATRDKYLVQ